VGMYKIGGIPSTKCPKVLLIKEILQNMHRNKKGVVYIALKSTKTTLTVKNGFHMAFSAFFCPLTKGTMDNSYWVYLT
jgi:hypothetical protein